MISVIVPIYNVEKYLEKCIESILAQTYTDYELILVNDGSTDGCYEICQKFSKRDVRIKLINKPNGGLSSARNVGIDNSKGDYITFVDSDDYISKYMLQELYRGLCENEADIAMCSFKRVKENETIVDENCSIKVDIHDSIECFRRIYTDKVDEYTVAWGKLYKSSLFQKIRYPEGKIHEDEFVTYKVFAQANRVVYIDTPLYFYLIRNQSIMHSTFSKKSLARLDAYIERIGYFETISKYELASMAAKRYIDKSAEYFVLMTDSDKYIIRNQAIDLYTKYHQFFKYETWREKIKIKSFAQCLGIFWIHHYFVKLGIAFKRFFKI